MAPAKGQRTLAVDPLWGQTCLAYHVQARFDPATARAIAELQQSLSERSPIALRLIPVHALHTSVVTMVPAQSVASAEARWVLMRDALADDLTDVHRHSGPIAISFRAISFTSRALTLWTPDQPAIIRDIRDRLCARLKGLGLAAPTYDRTHVTIARYAHTAHVDEAMLVRIEAEPVDLAGAFEALHLVREREYPSLVTEIF